MARYRSWCTCSVYVLVYICCRGCLSAVGANGIYFVDVHYIIIPERLSLLPLLHVQRCLDSEFSRKIELLRRYVYIYMTLCIEFPPLPCCEASV